MIEETGVVVSVQGDMAEVAGQPRHFGPERLLLQTHNPIGARPGERVIIGLPESALLEASVLAYLVPLAALIGGAVGGAFVAGFIAPAYTEVLSVLTGLGGLAATLAWLVRFIRAKSLDERYRPRILRSLATGPGAPPGVSL